MFMRSKNILFFIVFLFSFLPLLAQNTGSGIVIDDEGRGIEGVEVDIEGVKMVSEENGRFYYTSKTGGKPATDPIAVKNGYKMRFWLFNDNEVQIVMQPPVQLLEGQVTDTRLRPIKRVRVEIIGLGISPVYTNEQGFFVIKLPITVSITRATRFAVDGYEITAEDYSYSSADSYVSIKRLDRQKLYVYKPTKIENPVKGVKVFYDGKVIVMEKRQLLEIKTSTDPQEPLVFGDPQLIVTKNAENYVKIMIQNPNKVEVDSAELAKKNINASTDSYRNQIDNLMGDLQSNDYQKVSERISELAKQLDGSGLDDEKRAVIQAQLSKLEQGFEQNFEQNIKAFNTAKSTLSNLREKFLQKDSLLLLEQERTKKAEAEKDALEAEFQRNVIIGLSIMAVLLLLTFIALRVAKRIQNQRNQIQEAYKVIEDKNVILNIQKEEISVQAENLMEANAVITEKQAEVERQNREINLQHNSIVDSINYASRIQGALLPSQALITEHLPESFILFKPRDIVSGDFYWFQAKNQNLILTAADCTGHGVPGALMSMIGMELLNEIVNIHQTFQPAQILTRLHEGIKKHLKQEQTGGQDGMDLGLVRIDMAKNQIIFAGAKNPIYYVRQSEMPELSEIKGSSKGIGGMDTGKPISFEQEIIEVVKEESVMFYLLSDGYEDQFGGEKNKKFMKKNLKTMLLEIYDKPVAQQKQILDERIEAWKGDYEQTDDILIVGFRWKGK